jgi:pimeloyl-ACP methyl ester carboxylesterase
MVETTMVSTTGGRLARHVGGEYERDGLRVVTYGRPGFGRSTRLPGRSVACIADTLGLGSFGVVGASGGGLYALAVAARRWRRGGPTG